MIVDLRGENLEVLLGLPERIESRLLRGEVDEELLIALREHQLSLAESVIREGELRAKYIAGFDLTFTGDEDAIGAVVLYEVRGEWKPFKLELSERERLAVLTKVRFPYIPTFLAYRELPTLIALSKLLSQSSQIHVDDVIAVIDGQGIAHPRGLGIASHFGVATGWTSIGCAKRHLWGEVEMPPVGRWAPIKDGNGEIIGYLYRPSKGKRYYISTGHRISPQWALEVIKRSVEALGYPPTHSAHLLLQELRSKTKIQI